MKMKYLLPIMMFSLIMMSCKKEKVEDSEYAYSVQGHWTHYTTESDFKYLNIDGSGGYIEENSVRISENKAWYLKDQTLTYGRWANSERKFQIDSFPQVAVFDFEIGFNSVDSGRNYMWLDGNLYHD